MKLVEQIRPEEHKTDFRTLYIKYRAGRLKHQYWLWNRKRQHKVVDQYDAEILQNCQPGRTAFFCSAGYYLKDIWPDIDSIELHSITRQFYKDVILVDRRENIKSFITDRYDNFAVINNRGDHWVDVDGLRQHLESYTQVLNPSARLFYSFRDTQIHYNRLTVNHEKYFLDWANSLKSIGLDLVWHSIDFRKKQPDGAGNYDGLENPDTVNGNIKFWFVYQGQPWNVIQ